MGSFHSCSIKKIIEDNLELVCREFTLAGDIFPLENVGNSAA